MRSRHCKQEFIAIMSLSHREGGNGRLNCEPGDLPDCGTGNRGSGSRGLAVPNRIALNDDMLYNCMAG